MKQIALVFALFAGIFVSAQELSVEKREVVETFIGYVKANDRKALSEMTDYPMRRDYPIPPVKDAADFIARFDEIFDETLIKMILESNVAKDWSAVGWRGIMLGNGKVWIQETGELSAVNYQSAIEKQKKSVLIAADRAKLHESLRQFKAPVYVLETKNFIVRIDEISDGEYRYASWKRSQSMSEKPNLVINNGALEHHGSGGNHDVTFKNGKYKYVADIIVLGEDDAPPARLYVYKNGKEILVEDAVLTGR